MVRRTSGGGSSMGWALFHGLFRRRRYSSGPRPPGARAGSSVAEGHGRLGADQADVGDDAGMGAAELAGEGFLVFLCRRFRSLGRFCGRGFSLLGGLRCGSSAAGDEKDWTFCGLFLAAASVVSGASGVFRSFLRFRRGRFSAAVSAKGLSEYARIPRPHLLYLRRPHTAPPALSGRKRQRCGQAPSPPASPRGRCPRRSDNRSRSRRAGCCGFPANPPGQ